MHLTLEPATANGGYIISPCCFYSPLNLFSVPKLRRIIIVTRKQETSVTVLSAASTRKQLV